ncbi:MAG: wax ester/triacylglycerol synthase domain-containing protein, partial [Actinomycetes bacterium]
MIERADPNDLMQLAFDVGAVPLQIAGVVVLDPGAGLDLEAASALVALRLGRVPRLGQRLVRPPIGCGRAYWVDDATFDPGRHVHVTACVPPGDEAALLDTALALATRPLPRSRPLWSATFVTGLTGEAVALVVVL